MSNFPGRPPLNNPDLLQSRNFVNGQWITAASGKVIEVHNPATGELVATVPSLSQDETRRAIDAAGRAWPAWRALTAQARSRIVGRIGELMRENREDLAAIMTAEQGKPLVEAQAEIDYAAGFFTWFAGEAERAYGQVLQPSVAGRRILVTKEPIGVFAAITPWNFPAAMITRKAAPGWAAGCTGVIRPASQTPLSALAIAVLAKQAGMPDGVCNVVTGSAEVVGRELTDNPIVRKLSFTGSTEVGRVLLERCAKTIKKTSMELGGNAPFIVFDDADLDAAVKGVMASKFRNTGQTCVCANRILVQDSVYEAFSEKLKTAVEALVVGNGTHTGVTQGPLINQASVNKVEQHIGDTLAKGGRIVTGGKRHSLGGNFFQPTILADVPRDAQIFSEETFGPVAPLFRFNTEQEAIDMANDTPFGLASYFYSRDLGRVFRVAEALEYGIIGINEGLISAPEVPFGGMKESGLGREGGPNGIDEYLEVKYMAIGGLTSSHGKLH